MTAFFTAKTWATIERQERALRDQVFRGPGYWKSDLSLLQEFHSQVAQHMSDCFQKEGLPTIPAVGWDEAIAAIQLVTRCISQPRFMRECLPAVEQAYRFGAIPNDWFVEFYDTIMYFENKPQIFGTVFDWTESLDVAPWLIFEPSKLDERRNLFSLKPYAEDCEIRRDRWRESFPVPPVDYQSYFSSLEVWAKGVGWERKSRS